MESYLEKATANKADERRWLYAKLLEDLKKANEFYDSPYYVDRQTDVSLVWLWRSPPIIAHP